MLNKKFMLLILLFFAFLVSCSKSTDTTVIKDDTTHTPPKVVSFSAGNYHSLASTSDGSMLGWGKNNHGQTGKVGNVSAKSVFYSPQRVEKLPPIKMVSAGKSFSLALINTGEVYAFGKNSSGQIAKPINSIFNRPTKVSNLPKINYISASFTSIAVSANGDVYSWGSSTISPKKVKGITDVVMTSSGNGYHLALKQDGTVWAWGSNKYGLFGNNTFSEIPSDFPTIIPSLSNVKQIASGNLHSLALTYDGKVYSWGMNNFGQLGNKSTKNAYQPELIEGLDNVAKIECGDDYSLAITRSGELFAWGINNYGQLGTNKLQKHVSPTKVNTKEKIADVSAGSQHTLILTSSGKLYSFGFNGYGRLGLGKLFLNQEVHQPQLVKIEE